MERVTFLVERTGERIPCLLNPEHLEVRRTAGIVRRRSAGGGIIGNPRTDDPLIATGGGTTDYEFRLLFDVDLLSRLTPAEMPLAPAVGAEGDLSAALEEPESETSEAEPETEASTPETEEESDAAESEDEAEAPEPEDETETAEPEDETETAEAESGSGESASIASAAAPAAPSVDVRTLTQPLWALAENGEPLNGAVAPQRVRFIWGRSWNVPGVILAVAERHERFDAQGVPKRSWLTLLMRRVEEEVAAGNSPQAPTSPQFEINAGGAPTDDSGDDSVVVPVDDEGMALTPLYMVAAERYGDPRYDHAIADYNDLDDLLELEEGRPLRLPPPSSVAVEV